MPVTITDFPETINTLTSSSKCLECASPSQVQIATIYAMAQLLKYAGGTDYTNLATLNAAAKCYKCEPESTLKTFELSAWLGQAEELGMPTPTNSELIAALKCWQCMDPKAVKAAYTFLLVTLMGQIS